MGSYDLGTTTIGQLLDDSRVVELIDRYAPGMANSPMMGMAKDMTAEQVLQMAPAMLPPEQVARLRAELEKL